MDRKTRRDLSRRYLTGTPGAHQMLHDALKGHIGWSEDRGGFLVVDEKTLTMENLTTIPRGREGWAFELMVIDALD